MKPSVAITLIVAGVIVVAIPALWSGWDSLMVMLTLTHMSQSGSSINIPEVPPPYQLGCWVLGAGMIGVAILSSFGIGPGARRLAALPSTT